MARTRTRKAILLVDVEHAQATAATSSRSLAATSATTCCPATSPRSRPSAQVKEVNRVREQRARQEARTLDQAQTVAKKLSDAPLRVPARAGSDGRLYGSITTADLADEIWRTQKIRIDRRKVRLEEPIRHLGNYLIEIDVFPEVRASVTVEVAPVEGFDFSAGDDA